MRLFLSSYRAGNHAAELVKLFGKGIKVAVVTNAKDYKSPAERDVKTKELLDYLSGLGFKPSEVDLRRYFDNRSGLENAVAHFPAVWLAGGNVFLLRRALNYSGLDRYLDDFVRKNEVILAGESAGAIIVGPTLRFSEMGPDEDNPDFIPKGYDKEVIWEGLEFINYVPVPHFQDPDYGDEIDAYIGRLDKHAIPHKEMTNSQAIIINRFDEEFLG